MSEDRKIEALPVREFEDAVTKAAEELYRKTGAKAVRVDIEWTDCLPSDPFVVSTEMNS